MTAALATVPASRPAADAAATARSGADPAALRAFIGRHDRLLVLTGAGCSTDSGIPDYRDEHGAWKRSPPMTYQLFTGSVPARRRYWARSLAGWPVMAQAQPNRAHHALAALERRGRVSLLVTQNVDGLHAAAGSGQVVDLHGRLDRIACLQCAARHDRHGFQAELEAMNPGWRARIETIAPDGDADLDREDFDAFRVPVCAACGADALKPDVVFFGEQVPRERVDAVHAALACSDAMLVVGSSLMVFSGLRFARAAAEQGLPIAAVNLGNGRADALYTLHVRAPAGDALAFLLDPAGGQAGER